MVLRPKQMPIQLLSGVFLLLLSIFLGASWHVSSQLMFPPKPICNPEIFLHCGTPSDLGLLFQEIEIPVAQTGDGAPSKLPGWWIPACRPSVQGAEMPAIAAGSAASTNTSNNLVASCGEGQALASRQTIIFSHGHGGDRREGMRYASALHRLGFNLIAMDYGYAVAQSHLPNTMDWRERWELLAVVAYLKLHHMEQIGVYGMSQGGATTLMAMAEGSGIEAAALEASYADVEEEVATAFASFTGIPSFPIVNMAMEWFYLRSGAARGALSPVAIMARVKDIPLYLIHARHDLLVSFRHSERLFQLAPQAQTWFYDAATHVESWQFSPKEAEERMASFFKKALDPARLQANQQRLPNQISLKRP